jgi:hypothetical protein
VGYRAILEASPETVQDIALAAERRLKEAVSLALMNEGHAAIYLAGMAAEMLLKTACYFVDGARPADLCQPRYAALAHRRYQPAHKVEFEQGHGIWFWSQELIARRRLRNKPVPRRFLQAVAAIYADWFVGMRYRPGSAIFREAANFIGWVEWLARNHAALRT